MRLREPYVYRDLQETIGQCQGAKEGEENEEAEKEDDEEKKKEEKEEDYDHHERSNKSRSEW